MTALMLACLALLPCFQWGRTAIQPWDSVSADGSWKLHVDPTTPEGEGPMRCRLTHGGELAWEQEWPWTFVNSSVANDGTVVGYANLETLRIVVLDSRGAVRKQHDLEHEAWIVHGPALPCAFGPVLVLDAEGLALIRVLPADQRRPAPWRTLRFATGELIGTVTPECPGERRSTQSVHERDARVVGSTGLILCQWWYVDYRPAQLDYAQEGAIFVLVDSRGKSLWSLQWLDDYTDPGSEADDDRLWREVSQSSPILEAGPANRFSLKCVKSNERVTFAIDEDAANPGQVSVREVSREPRPRGPSEVATASTTSLKPEEPGRVTIGRATTASDSPIRDVLDFGFTEYGELELVRRSASGNLSYARLRPQGELVFEHDLSRLMPSPGARLQTFELTGDRWLLSFRDAQPNWIEVDGRTGGAKPCPLPLGRLDTSIAPTADGGYVALVPQIVQGVSFTGLYRVGSDGKLARKLEVMGLGPDTTDLERAVYFGRGIAHSGVGRYTLLGMEDLTVITDDERVLQSTPIAGVIGREPSYVSNLLSDRRGGVYFCEGNRFWNADAEGRLEGSPDGILPRRSDGSLDPAFINLCRVAPDRRVWTSDGSRLYRLDESGQADLVLGPPQVDQELAESQDHAIDSRGRVLLRDRFSEALHVFDAQGSKLFVFQPSNAERVGRSLFESFRTMHDGTIWMVIRNAYVHIGAGGERLESSLRDPEFDYVLSFRGEIDLLDPVARARELIERRPDGTWLTGKSGAALLRDGRLVLAADLDERESTRALYFYTPAGKLDERIALPESAETSHLSASARWIVLGSYGPDWTLVRLSDRRIFRFASGLPDPGNWHAGQSPDGKVLLLLNGSRRELVRFALP